MEGRLKRWRKKRNFANLLQYREVNAEMADQLKRKAQFCGDFIKKLDLETELEGHDGCVNCLEWSPNGLQLASGSDDTNVILWDPFRHKQLQVVPTPHMGNIFSVKFLADDVVATAAGDCRVIVQSIAGAVQKNLPLLDCACHIGRVKRLATSPEQPSLFWSAGEDGLVVQYDMREPHECPTHGKVLIDLSFKSELKCIAVNPTKPHYVAIGANDCYVRLYDRRMIKVCTSDLSIHATKRTTPQPLNTDCVQYYAPGHLAKEYKDSSSVKLAVTYIAFNSAGTEMLANIGGEQIYLFDVNQSRHINELRVPRCLPKRSGPASKPCCEKRNVDISMDSNEEWLRDVSPDCACFFIRRAQDAFQRRWLSDIYGSARDYLHVIQHWPNLQQAYIGLMKCLIVLKWTEEAKLWLKHFQGKFPDHRLNAQIRAVSEDLQTLKKCDKEPQNGVKSIEEDEKKLRLNSFDFEARYLGHCNTTTDIKEATFMGADDSHVCAGSDEGIIFIWNKRTMEITQALTGDNSIVNCVQPHPSACILASSGIDNAVKIWSPRSEDAKTESRMVKNISTIIANNQHRMCMDPFESMLASMGYQVHASGSDTSIEEVPPCRTS